MLGRPSADKTEYFLYGAILGKKNQKEEIKPQNPKSSARKKLLHAT
jgi:hypothetical protein